MQDNPFKKKADDLGVPLIPPLPEKKGNSLDPNPTVAVCGQCGLEIKKVMGYVCPNRSSTFGGGCPVQPSFT